MIKRIFSSLAFAALCTAANASVTINLAVGQLYGTTAGSVFPDGGLVQLIASTTDSVFSAPTVGAFTSGDDVVLAAFGLDQSTVGVSGSASHALTLNYSGDLGVGDSLLLRWFPTLTTSSTAASLVAGTSYGQFSNLLTEVDGSTRWVLPADGQSVDLLFLNSQLGGSYADTLSLASLTVTAVPEPSTYAALLGAMVLGVVGYRRYRRS